MGAYTYHTTVTIGMTNLLQNMYFCHFFSIQGVVRELWVAEHVPGAMESLANGLVLITHSASCRFLKDFYLYDPVVVEMSVADLRNASAELVFRFLHGKTGQLHAEGSQRIVFADGNHRICRIPDNFRTAALGLRADST